MNNLVINDKFDVISNLDLSLITNKLIYVYKWNKEDAMECEKLYRNFLLLNLKYWGKESIAPTEEIDLFWHEHILDTKKYQEDCMNIFGQIMHHFPYAGLPNSGVDKNQLLAVFNRTQELHFKEFGCYMYDIRVGFLGCLKSLYKIISKKSNDIFTVP